jgi:hypothetical protein
MSNRKSRWFHRTTADRVKSITTQGLVINSNQNLTLDGDWSFIIYGCRPIFVSQQPDTSYKTDAPCLFEVNADDLPLVADLPRLVDLGAYYDIDDYAMWFKKGPELYFDDLLNPYNPVCIYAIQKTQSAVCLTSIPSHKLRLCST